MASKRGSGKPGRSVQRKPATNPQGQVTLQQHQQTVVRSGPLPEATELEAFEKVLPGLADRIVTMAETQQSSTIQRAQTVDTDNFKYANRGQIFALVVAITGITTAGIVVALGEPWGASISFTALAPLVGKFIDKK